MFKKKVITRFAPSPTGMLHIGGLRTALYSYLLAKQKKGRFILRIEDTDRSRFVEGAVDNIIETLESLGIHPDNKPYYQSEHLDNYKKYADKLVEDNNAYYCFCSAERLAEVREKQIANKQPTKYDGHCRKLSADEVKRMHQLNKPYVIRLKMPASEDISFDDAIRGHVSINSANLDDQVIMKSDGFPTYHLAVVVDDYEMGVTHVVRGEEWLPSTPKHILLYKYLSWKLPTFAHMPLLLNKDRSKLSKRQGDVAASDYLNKGYLPAAIINFISLLGWNPGNDREMFTMDELKKEFSLDKMNKAGAIFDLDKLNWFGLQYMQNLDLDTFYNLSREYLEKNIEIDIDKYTKAVASAAHTRISYFAEIPEVFSHIFNLEDYDSELLIFKKSTKEDTVKGLKLALEILTAIEDNKWNENLIQLKLQEVIKEANLGNGDVFWPIRMALSGKEKSESPVELLLELGKDESIRRINIALKKL
ncbi:MAG: glutamate--tRNA ligase [Candidatus Komeilibacteria bacterium]